MVYMNMDELTGKAGMRYSLFLAGSFSGPTVSFCDDIVDVEQFEDFADDVECAQDVEQTHDDDVELTTTEVAATSAETTKDERAEVVVIDAPHLERELESVNHLHYKGKVGDRIYIKVSDVMQVDRVTVIIYESDAEEGDGRFKEVERGDAVHMVERGWEYTASTNIRSLRSTEAVIVVVVNEMAEWVLGDALECWVREHVVA